MNDVHDPMRIETIVEKAEFVERCLAMLADGQLFGFDEYAGDAATRDVVERRFEKATQAGISPR